MPVEIKMPQMGESIAEGTLVRWLKKPGDPVLRDEPLFEISTDKVDTEIPSPAAGKLGRVLVEEGQTVPVNTPVCILDAEDGNAPAAPPEVTASSSTPAGTAAARSPAPQPRAGDRRGPRLSPAVRRLAREHGIDLAAVTGTGAGGRISRNDVLAYLASRERPQDVGSRAKAQLVGEPPALEGRVEPLSPMRRAIAKHMVESRRTSAHVSTVHEADMTHVVQSRESLRQDFESKRAKLTYLTFVVQAVARALREFPQLNASIVGDEVHYKGDVHIGIAVALETGLIVPVVRNADTASLLELARRIDDLARRARSKQLSPAEVRDGTFTITNPGVFGTLIGTPIINQPQVGILCLGAVQKRPVVLPREDAIAIRSMTYLSLTFDHRLVDGAVADRFLQSVRNTLENGKFHIE